MKIDYYKPKNKFLNLYIEGYYFISDWQSQDSLEYYTFPNNYGILSISEKANVQLKDDRMIISHNPEATIYCSFINQYKKPIHIVYKNAVQEITMYFKPIGIHHFVNNPLLLMNESNSSLNLFEDFDSTMITIFKIDNRDQQIEHLEKYWLSKLKQKNELLRLEKIIQDIEKGEKIELIARKNNLSRQYINKIFSKYVGKSPTEYRRINRFRNALFNYKNEKKLTTLSYDNLYFDQAHFNKDFKNFTNINPRLFFNHIDNTKPIIWFYGQ